MTATPRASVVIPTKNGGAIFERVLDAVFAQRCEGGVEVVVVDSGSTDGTLDVLARHDCHVIRIAPESFDHGDTRNRGIAESHGEFIAMLTQDACPTDDRWLAELVAPFATWPDVAGAFGRHVAHPGADPLVAARLDRHFRQFGSTTTVYRRPANSDYRRRADFYDFFSNNNSALRRSAWERHPFPRTMMAEDQRWARAVMAEGWAKAYVPEAVVQHSHNYTAAQSFRRAFDEWSAFAEMRRGEGVTSASVMRGFAGNCLADARALLAQRPGGRMRLATRSLSRNVAEAGGTLLGRNSTHLPHRLRQRLTLQRTGGS